MGGARPLHAFPGGGDLFSFTVGEAGHVNNTSNARFGLSMDSGLLDVVDNDHHH